MASKPGAIVGYGTQIHIMEPLIMTDAQKAGIPQQTPSANATQVGGDHYSKFGTLQHWDVVAHFGLDYFQGQITKYVMRWKSKGKIQDLKKARHFLDKYIELEEAAELKKELATHSEASRLSKKVKETVDFASQKCDHKGATAFWSGDSLICGKCHTVIKPLEETTLTSLPRTHL